MRSVNRPGIPEPIADPEHQLARSATSVFAGGKWTVARSCERLPVNDSHTEQVIGSVRVGLPEDVDLAVAAARVARPDWSQTPAADRRDYLIALANELGGHREFLANLITEETGTPLESSRTLQVDFAADLLHSFAAVTPDLEQTRHLGNAIIREVPRGVVGAIVPWNLPLASIVLKLGAALAAGCTVVVKPSEVAPLDAVILAEAIAAAGIPPGVANIVFGTGVDVGEALVRHHDVDCISFTGSTGAGRRISEIAAGTLKPVSLELGGKSAMVVLDDADLPAAVARCIDSAMLTVNGQACDALTRLVVPRSMRADTESIIVDLVEKIAVGDPKEPRNQLGPLVSRKQQERLDELITSALSRGARALVGGPGRPEYVESGYYARPTVLTCESSSDFAAQVEFFGPVITVLGYETESEALAIANDSEYGLSGCVWSGDRERASSLARQMRAGQVYVNDADYNIFAPYGGFGQSGHGREQGEFGVREFLTLQALLA